MNSAERSWHFVLARAFREKNFVFITNLVRWNGIASLPPSQRDYLAETLLQILTGRYRYPANKPPSTAARVLRENVAMRILEYDERGIKPDAANNEIAREFGKSEAYVRDVRKDLDAADKHWRKIQDLQLRSAHPAEFEKAIRDYLSSCSKTTEEKRGREYKAK
jgi:hypothetical protein